MGRGLKYSGSCHGQDAEWTEGWSQERKQVVSLEWQAPLDVMAMQCDGHVARGMRAVRGQ